MTHFRRTVLLAASLVLAALLIFPPYFGIDRSSGGTLHASMGHHPIWDPPAPARVYEQLTGNASVGAPEETLEMFEAGFNKVRLAIEVAMLACITGVALLAGNVLRRIRERRKRS